MLSKKIMNASLITVIFTIIVMFLGIFTQSLISRIYGPDGLGLYASFIMFISLYSMAAIFGIPFSLSKYVAEYDEIHEVTKIKTIFSSVLLFTTFSSLIIGFFAFYVTPYIAKNMQLDFSLNLNILVSVTLIFYVYSQISQSYYRGILNALKCSIIDTLPQVGILCIIIYTYFFSLIPIYYSIFFGYTIAGIYGLLLCTKDKVINIIFSKDELYKIIKFALPIALTSYFVFISQWVDRISLGVYLGVTEIGLYTAGMTITQATRRIPTALNPILVSSYSKISVHGKQNVEVALNLNIKLTAIFLFLIGSLTFLYAKDIVYVLYGSEFSQTITVLKILSIGTFFTAITLPLSSLITGSGHPKLNFYLSCIAIPTQIILIVLMTKYYGMIGTAISNPLVSLIYVFGTIYMVSNTLKISIEWDGLIKTFLAWICFIASYFLVLILFKNSIAAGLLGTITYSIVCWKYVLSDVNKKIIFH